MSQQSGPSFRRAYFYGVSGLLSVGFILVFARLIYLQGIQHEEWLARAERAQEKRVTLHAERGAIYDRNGKTLAMNVERPSLYAVPSEIENRRFFARRLAPLLGISRKQLLQKLQSGRQFAWLQRKISPKVKKEIEVLGIKGIGFVMESKRIYPKRALSGHLLGFAGLDNQGLEGIERKYDKTLRGEEGWLVLERDASGRSLFPKNFEYRNPSTGKDLTLTIDEVIQHISEREIDRVVQKTGAIGGTVIVMDPWNGEILAMAISPKFDPNHVRTAAPSQWRNRAISDFYEPGSTFKVVTAAAAIEENLVQPDELVDCEEGAYRVKGGVIHDHDAIGVIPFHQVVARSSNIGIIKIAEILGPKRLAHYIDDFGFGKRLGIGLSGESPGLVRDQKLWSGRSLASIAIGQEVGVTPLQVVSATSVLANGGWLMTPRIVKESLDRDRGNQAAFEIKRRVLSEATTSKMTQILRTVVSESGTARHAALPGFAVAGKTGTAQKIDPETGKYSKEKFVSSFVGFVPANDPVITILVMVDEPEGIAWGGEVAAPVFATIAKEVLRYLKVPPQMNTPAPYFPPPEIARPVKAVHVFEKKKNLVQQSNRMGPHW